MWKGLNQLNVKAIIIHRCSWCVAQRQFLYQWALLKKLKGGIVFL
jgi:hypothetical protein